MTLRGDPWTGTAAKRLLDQGFAAGSIHLHDPDCARPCDPGKPGPNRIHLPGAHEALAALDLWGCSLHARGRAPLAASPVRTA